MALDMKLYWIHLFVNTEGLYCSRR